MISTDFAMPSIVNYTLSKAFQLVIACSFVYLLSFVKLFVVFFYTLLKKIFIRGNFNYFIFIYVLKYSFFSLKTYFINLSLSHHNWNFRHLFFRNDDKMKETLYKLGAIYNVEKIVRISTSQWFKKRKMLL